MNKYLIVIFVIFYTSCNKENKDENITKQVFKDVFFRLVDTTSADFRRIIGPSPEDFSSEDRKKQFYKKVDSLKEIKLPPLKVIINNSTYKLNLNGFKYRVKNYLNEKDIDEILSFKDSTIINELNLNLNNFSNEKYNFVYKKDLDSSIRQSRLGKFSFSKLHFNKAKTVCVFSYGLYYSSLNGTNFLCILKKEKNTWQIHKILEVGIS
ncbi:hypothetical protein [Olleya sp. Bg11-27]|uniref:hypothetical protein n=1 Tax=Olleya sp. Bg11-27 TaxID=2058135 RepID=UPI000C31A2AE|nr:hypothetical protein [Olleya sp. Bg11-27]AUC74274.1 hypothetical protein CW732_00705 [Olleya sp. Bg11-27]